VEIEFPSGGNRVPKIQKRILSRFDGGPITGGKTQFPEKMNILPPLEIKKRMEWWMSGKK